MVDQITAMYEISIHALRKESDPMVGMIADDMDISIHGLRKESDLFITVWYALTFYFNPRSP